MEMKPMNPRIRTFIVEETFADDPTSNDKFLMDEHEIALSYPAIYEALDTLLNTHPAIVIIDVTYDLFTLKILGDIDDDTDAEAIPI